MVHCTTRPFTGQELPTRGVMGTVQQEVQGHQRGTEQREGLGRLGHRNQVKGISGAEQQEMSGLHSEKELKKQRVRGHRPRGGSGTPGSQKNSRPGALGEQNKTRARGFKGTVA